MAIAGYKPTSAETTEPNTPTIQPKDYKSVIYSDDNVPISSLLAFAEGAPWSVDYYQQVLSRDNDLREVDPTAPNIYQQYNLIKNMEIRVSSALSTNYDSNTGLTNAPGNGYIYPFLIPNINDYFVTDAGDTRKAMFRITNVERKTFNRDSGFSIDYELVGYTQVLQETYNGLNDRVIRNYYFSKDRLIENLQPILKDEDYQQISSLKTTYRELVLYYFKTFFNRRYMTVVLPGQTHGIYDPFLTRTLLKIVNTEDAPEIRLMKQIPTDNDPFLSQPQFWELMETKDYDGVSMCNQKMGIVSKYLFNRNTWLQGLFFSNIDYVVYPDTPDVSVLVAQNPDAKLLSSEEIIETANVQGSLADMLSFTYVLNNTTIPVYTRILEDDYYVMGRAFYEDTDQKSLIEILVKDYLKQQTLSLEKLYKVVETFRRLSRLEQFYYGPILMILIKEADRASYT